MLEEYVRSLGKIQKEEPHTKQSRALRGQPFCLKAALQKRSGPEYSSK